MAKKSTISRRKVLLTLGTACLAVSAVPAWAADSGEKIDESDNLAQQLGYKHDASQAANRAAATHNCSNCAFFQGGDQTWGGCIVFGGKQANAKGWCQSWRSAG